MPSPYHYTECGLDHIWVQGVSVETDEDGMECYTIPNLRALHQAIAREIVFSSGMSGAELRFLRTEMGMTQAELARLLHKTALTISRWERNEKPIDPNAMTIIRLQATEQLALGQQDPIAVVIQRSTRQSPVADDICFTPRDDAYVRIAA